MVLCYTWDITLHNSQQWPSNLEAKARLITSSPLFTQENKQTPATMWSRNLVRVNRSMYPHRLQIKLWTTLSLSKNKHNPYAWII